MLTLITIFLITRYRLWKMRKQLKWQQQLASKGIGFRTRLIEIYEKSRTINGYKRFCIRAMLRVNGTIVCKKMYTLMKAENKLHEGDRVLIRYFPSHPDHVLLAS